MSKLGSLINWILIGDGVIAAALHTLQQSAPMPWETPAIWIVGVVGTVVGGLQAGGVLGSKK